jgi:membrane fusion protein, copper/silver efflux system
MTLRPILMGIGLVAALAGGAAGLSRLAARADDGTVPESAAAKTSYTCGMHPEVVQDHPGNCPKCGMKLQPMTGDRAAAMGLTHASASTSATAKGAPSKDGKVLYWKSSMSPGEIHDKPGKDSMGMDLIPVYEGEAAAGTIQIDPVVEQDMGVRVDTVKRGPLAKTVRTVGFVDYDETTLTIVTTKVDGWVEKLYVNQTGAQVHEGEPLFALYSPALFSAQEEYLAALRNLQTKDVPLIPRSRGDSQSLVRDARTRLEYFDISPGQIAELERTGTVRKTLTIRAPFTGIVTNKNVVEGQRIMAGMEVLRIADLSTVWVIAKVFEYDVPYVLLGQEAFMTLDYLPGRTFRGRVTYVYPYLDAKSREVSARMEFHNPGYELKPGMYATVTLVSKVADEATLVPDVAVIDTGLRSVVFVMPQAGRFEAREVKIGRRGEHNHLEVLSGLDPGETVVVSGQFLLDSESRLREAALKFMEPGTVGGAQPVVDATKLAEARAHPDAPSVEKGDLYYVCPMPEHTDILYDKPGKCPICGMTLVPVQRRAGHVESPHIAYWACPMPEHSSIHEPGPGKCPLCGMTLIPVPDTQAQNETPQPPHAHAADPE